MHMINGLTEHRIRAAQRARRALRRTSEKHGDAATMTSLEAVTGVLRQRFVADAAMRPSRPRVARHR
jgi:23S rRNA maturation mini-RNase III